MLKKYLLLLAHMLLLPSTGIATASAVGTAVGAAASKAELYAGRTSNTRTHVEPNVTQSAGTALVENVTATAC
jgi:hypothetical protein